MSSRNRYAQELREQTATQDSNCHPRFSRWKLQSKNTCLTMWALCNSLTRRYLPSNPHNNWLRSYRNKQRLRSKILSHIINV